MNYLAIKSAYEIINKPDIIFFYYKHMPEGEWWEKARPYLTLEKIDPPKKVFDRELLHIAHISDVLRLQILILRGIYLDIDTICVKSFFSFLQYEFVIGEQVADNHLQGCNR